MNKQTEAETEWCKRNGLAPTELAKDIAPVIVEEWVDIE